MFSHMGTNPIIIIVIILLFYFNYMGIVSIKRIFKNKLQLQKQNSEYMCNTNDFAWEKNYIKNISMEGV